MKRSKTISRVGATVVVLEGINTSGRVLNAGSVVKERQGTGGDVVAAACVRSERKSTGGEPIVLLKSALLPLAVFCDPVVLR